ncbi:MAG: deaminase domain-containing protein, partial [Hafnia sp.]
TAVRSGVRVALPEFGSLFQKLTVSLVKNAIPFHGMPTLGFRLVRGSIKGLYAGLQSVLRPVYKSIRTAVGRTGSHSFIDGFAHIDNPASWRQLVGGDQLASLRGMHDVPVRNVASAGKSDFRLIDPLSSQPYGPLLSRASGELSLGRSRYNILKKHSSHVTVAVAGNTRVREVFDVDGRTTVFLDDVPYRLDEDALRRVSSLDDSDKFKQIPCRIRRGLDDVCKYEYVLSDRPAERPRAGTVSEEKSWAPWFGDRTFHPSTAKSATDPSLLAYEGKIYQLKDGKLNTYKGKPEWIGLDGKIPVPKATVSANLEFQTGIYGSIKVTGTAEKIDDVHIVGAIIVPSIDGKTKYVFTQLNFDDYYIASVSTDHSILAPLTMKKLSLDELREGTVGHELKRVYVGSLNANNSVRVHGTDKLERALRKMDEIARPIGTPKKPSESMKWLKVNTNSAEALMFDQKTRLIVADLPDGAALWKPSALAPEELQKSTEATFNTLFSNPASAFPSSSRANVVNIDQAMEQLKKLLPPEQSSEKLRNIAYAKVRTAAGRDEVYVSVSGAGDNTRHLPLFKSSDDLKEVNVTGTIYFNIDKLKTPTGPTSLHLSDDGKLLAIPHPISDASNVDHINWATSADSESKLVSFINNKYPSAEDIKSITVVTTLPPCDSCSIVMKEFGHERGASALNVIWGKRPNLRKRPHTDSSSSQSSSTHSD